MLRWNRPGPARRPRRSGQHGTIAADLAEAGHVSESPPTAGGMTADRAFAEAIWCLVAHLRPQAVVETGVAHGLTSRVILEGLFRNGRGPLWSVDLPAVDSALHSQIGMAVSEGLRPRWSYVQGTAHVRLPGLLAELGAIDIFVHDSLHTGRNQRFEIESAWRLSTARRGSRCRRYRPHSLAFLNFVRNAEPAAWLAAGMSRDLDSMGPDGLWGVAIKNAEALEKARAVGPYRERLRARGRRVARAARMRVIGYELPVPGLEDAAEQIHDARSSTWANRVVCGPGNRSDHPWSGSNRDSAAADPAHVRCRGLAVP